VVVVENTRNVVVEKTHQKQNKKGHVMNITKEQLRGFEDLLERAIYQRDSVSKEVDSYKRILEDSSKEIKELKEIVKDKDLTIRAKDKHISNISSKNLALEVTLKETVVIMNDLLNKLSTSNNKISNEKNDGYDSADALLYKFNELV
jgi:uncharacterized coiled-coil DUF342 family protein